MNHEQQQRAAGSGSIYLPCVQLLPGACREIPAGLGMAPQTRCRQRPGTELSGAEQ